MFKYKITSATPHVKMMVQFVGEDGLNVSLNVDVDFQNERVFFPDCISDEFDLGELKKAIFDFLRPVALEAPALPPEVVRRIEQVKSGDYGPDVNSFLGHD